MPPIRASGTTTFMLNLMRSTLVDCCDFVPFSTSRPVKPDVVDNWGYRGLLNAGVGRAATAVGVTAAHIVTFPFVVLRQGAALVQVHASAWYTFWESTIYVGLARALGRPTVLRLGGDTDHFYRASSAPVQGLIRSAIGLPHGLIVQSEYWKTFVAGLGRSDGVVVVGNFVDDAWIAEADRSTTETPMFLFSAGSEAKRKGVDDVLAAAETLAAKGVRFRLLIVASSPSIDEAVRARSLEGVVETMGFVEHDEMRDVFARADAFLLPTYAEGLPNALLEAMASGLPAVATPVGAIPEVLHEGRGGFLVPVAEPEQLADRMGRLATDPVLRRRMGQYNRQRVREQYTASAVLDPLTKLYSRLLSGGSDLEAS